MFVSDFYVEVVWEQDDVGRFPHYWPYRGESKGQFREKWWRHQMETFCVLLAICAANSPVPGEFPTQRPVRRSFEVFFDLRPN